MIDSLKMAPRAPGALGTGALALALALALAALAGAPARGQDEEKQVGLDARRALTVTVYKRNLAHVVDRRAVALDAGANRLALLELSRQLRPETLVLGGDGLLLVEQSFDANLLTPRALLERSLGKSVWIRRRDPGDGPGDGSEGYLEAILASAAETPLVLRDGRLESVALADLAFAPGTTGLRNRPTLLATVRAAAAGERALDIGYLTGGLSWQADYVATLDAAGERFALTAMITLRNHSGTPYRKARLRLVAGDVSQTRPLPLEGARMEMADGAMMAAAAPPVPSQAVGDRHLYELERPVTLGDREIKQVALFTANAVPLEKEYRFQDLVSIDGPEEMIEKSKPDIVLRFGNDADAGLGRPMPAGVIRVFQEPASGDGAAVFLGEDRIAHGAEGQELELTTGRAFDITGGARRTALERISDEAFESGQEITVENAKDTPVTVEVIGHMPRGWRMLEESLPHRRETANRIAWSLKVPAGGSASFRYKVRVTWP